MATPSSQSKQMQSAFNEEILLSFLSSLPGTYLLKKNDHTGYFNGRMLMQHSCQNIKLSNLTHINARRGWYGRVGLVKFIRGTLFRSDWLFVDEALKCWASRDIIPSSDGMNLFIDLLKLVNIFWREGRWIFQHNILLAILLKNKQINDLMTRKINPLHSSFHRTPYE